MPDQPAEEPIEQVLAEVYAAFTAALGERSEDELARPSRAEAWTVRELLVHQLGDARRALVALATPAEGPADVDAASYWRAFQPGSGDGGAAEAQWVVRSAAAYAGSAGLIAEWRDTSEAAARAAAAAMAADPQAVVATQGHALAVVDLVSTLVVEATVHLLDAWTDPPAAALAHTIGVLERLHGGPLPPAASPAEQVLQATGRAPSGHAAYPLLG